MLHVEIITLAITVVAATPGALPFVGPAYDTAKDDTRIQYPRLNITQNLIYSYPNLRTCADWSTETNDAATKFYYRKLPILPRGAPEPVVVFLYPGCVQDETTGLACIGSQMDKLVITTTGTDTHFPNEAFWPSWITTTFHAIQPFRQMVINVMDFYGWDKAAFVCDLDGIPFFSNFVHVHLNAFIQDAKRHIVLWDIHSNSDVSYLNLLRATSRTSRVLFFFGQAAPFHKMLTTAQRNNMTGPDFVYIAFCAYRASLYGNYTWDSDLSTNSTEDREEAKMAYRSAFVIEPYGAAENNDDLIRLWKTKSLEVYNYKYAPGETVYAHAFATYAAMMMLAQVLEEIREQGDYDTLKSGTAIASHMKNRTFLQRTGPLSIGEHGDRFIIMALTQTDVDNGTVRSVLVQFADRISANSAVHWPGGLWPPPAEPRCGLSGDAPICQRRDLTLVYAISALAVFGVLLVALAVLKSNHLLDPGGSAWWILAADVLVRYKSAYSTAEKSDLNSFSQSKETEIWLDRFK